MEARDNMCFPLLLNFLQPGKNLGDIMKIYIYMSIVKQRFKYGQILKISLLKKIH